MKELRRLLDQARDLALVPEEMWDALDAAWWNTLRANYWNSVARQEIANEHGFWR
jgi:hypothetical protein